MSEARKPFQKLQAKLDAGELGPGPTGRRLWVDPPKRRRAPKSPRWPLIGAVILGMIAVFWPFGYRGITSRHASHFRWLPRAGRRHHWIGRELDAVLEGCAEEGGNHNERRVA